MKNSTLKTLCGGGLLSAAALLGMTGCSANFGAVPSSARAGVAFSGNVHGGQQAVVGAQIYLYAVGTGGLGTAAASRLNSPGYVTTGAGGAFDVTNDYTCQAGDQVYLLALGGNPGLPGTVNNSYIALMAALGSCGSLGTTQFVTINEVTTTAAVYALSQFMSSPTSIASSNSAAGILGITHAFATANNLVDTSTGIARTKTVPGNGTVDQARINTLADAIAPCINSSGTSGATDNCPSLSTAATGSATGVTNTASALLAIARNPYFNPSGVFGLINAQAPFFPNLSAAPDAFVMPIAYTGAGVGNSPGDVGISAAGDVWVVSQDTNSVAAFHNDGTPLTGSPFTGNGIVNPGSLAWDSRGNVDVTDFNTNSVSSFTSTGTALTPNIPGGAGGLNGPGVVAVDVNGNLWVTNNNSTISEFNSNLVAISPAGGYTSSKGSAFTGLFYVATDQLGNAYFTENSTVLKLGPGGTEISPAGGYSACGSLAAYAVSIDSANQPWVQCFDGGSSPNFGTRQESVVKLDTAGNATPYPINASQQIVNFIDAANNVWILDVDRSRIQEVNSAGTVLTANIQTSTTNPSPYGFSDGGIYQPQAIRGDSSGNLWISNITGGTTNTIPLIEYVGLAAPTRTPLYLGTLTP